MPMIFKTLHPSFQPGRWLIACAGVLSSATGVAAVCTVSATPTVFGAYDTLYASHLQINSAITVACIVAVGSLQAIPYNISLGVSASSGTMTRAMAGPLGARLQYNLFTNAAYATVWGNGAQGSQSVASSVTPLSLGTVALQSHTVYGRIPALQAVRVGAYTDAIVVTVDY